MISRTTGLVFLLGLLIGSIRNAPEPADSAGDPAGLNFGRKR